ncbi:hypothetical protein IWW36_002800 [Coemansia brasiliensis]|uniref:MIR domain-containing protein n=1 Tax=Coemansia brasiliensis TaxID=2650707 RepID=A0A9W8IF68_9FUNG|nr:hypothetical protein IWW36_002800 [Coemansia brasiliensis]
MAYHSQVLDPGFGDESNGPQPSRYKVSHLTQSYATTLVRQSGDMTRSSTSTAGPTAGGPSGAQYNGSGPQPYSTPGNATAGPNARPPQQRPPPPANNASGPQAYPQTLGATRPPPQQYPPPSTQSVPNMPLAFTPYPGASTETSSIYSGPHPGNGHTSSTINTTSGAYYAPTTNSSSSGISEGYGYPQQQPYQHPSYQQQHSSFQQQQQHPYPQQQHPYPQQQQQPYPQHQQQPQAVNVSTVYSTASYSPTQGPSFSNNVNMNNNSGPTPGNVAYAPSIGGPTVYGRPQYAQSAYGSSIPEPATSRMGTAGAIATGAIAAGALAYGVHKYREGASEEEKKEQQRKQWMEAERVRRESDARRQREEEEQKRRNEYERWRREENDRYMQQITAPKQQYSNPPSVVSYHTGRYRSESRASSHSSHHNDRFHPPDPFGRAPYTFDPRDIRHPDPTRSSENSKTAQTYPELWQKPSDTTIKIGSMLALKHLGSGRHLRTDRSHSTQSGSNQQLVYAHGWATDELDRWQVLPANTETPAPGSIISYGTQVRLRHYETGRHLHSHYGFFEPVSGQNEVTAFGDQTQSDENDHWVIERWGDGGYGQTWKATDPIVLRHYVSGMTLCSHNIHMSDDIQAVLCSGPGHGESDKWRVVLDC